MPRLPRRRGRWLAALALLAVAAVVVVIVESNSGSPTTGSGAGTTATGATSVQRRNLVATDTESGTLSYANSQTVYNRLSGTITWVPPVGRVVRPGQILFKVDNVPVLLMNGSTPAFRELQSSDDKGPDIYELNRNLVDLGYNPDGIVVDDTWQSATTAGIDAMQEALGETETGKLTLGQVVFLPGPQMVQTVDTTVGSTGGSPADYRPSSGSNTEFVDYTHGATDTPTDTTGTDTTGTDTTGTDTTTTDTTTTTGTTTTASTTTPLTTTTAGTTTPTTTPSTGTTTPVTTPATKTTPRHSSTTPKSSTTPNRNAPHSNPPHSNPPHSNAPHSNAPHSNGPSSNPQSGSDNLSQRTLQALMRLIQQQQRQLQALEHGSHSPGSSGNPSSGNSGSHNPSSGSSNPSSSSSNPSSGSSNPSSGNGGGGNAVAVMTTSSTKLVVTVDLGASVQSEATIGEHVTVEMPDGSTVGGKVTAVSPVAQSSTSGDSSDSGGSSPGGSSGDTGSSTVPVTITLDKAAKGAGLDQASVSVNFVQNKASNVLSVPVTALLATSGSSFAVQEAAAPHKLIPVQTGLFAAGYVQISGAGIYPGLKVTDSQG